jgi:hypothetical protein
MLLHAETLNVAADVRRRAWRGCGSTSPYKKRELAKGGLLADKLSEMNDGKNILVNVVRG